MDYHWRVQKVSHVGLAVLYLNKSDQYNCLTDTDGSRSTNFRKTRRLELSSRTTTILVIDFKKFLKFRENECKTRGGEYATMFHLGRYTTVSEETLIVNEGHAAQ